MRVKVIDIYDSVKESQINNKIETLESNGHQVVNIHIREKQAVIVYVKRDYSTNF